MHDCSKCNILQGAKDAFKSKHELHLERKNLTEKDQCMTCCKYNILQGAEDAFQSKHELHLERKKESQQHVKGSRQDSVRRRPGGGEISCYCYL